MARLLAWQLDVGRASDDYEFGFGRPRPRGTSLPRRENKLTIEMLVTDAEAQSIYDFLRRQTEGEAEQAPALPGGRELEGEFVDPPKLPKARRG